SAGPLRRRRDRPRRSHISNCVARDTAREASRRQYNVRTPQLLPSVRGKQGAEADRYRTVKPAVTAGRRLGPTDVLPSEASACRDRFTIFAVAESGLQSP